MNHLLYALQSYTNWIVWNPSEFNTDHKQTKIPYSVVNNGKLRASVSDSSTWTTLEAAQTFIAANPQFQLGFVLSADCGLCCLDFDTYKANGDSSIIEEHKQIHDWFNSYSELSPSGKGVHLWVYGSIPSSRRWNEKHIELYSSARYLTVTGNVLNNAPIANCQQQLNELIAQFPPDKPDAAAALDLPEVLTDEQVCKQAANASNGELFQTLYRGQWQGRYPSQSEADQSLMNLIAFYCESLIQCARIFHTSELGKRKKAQRKDYIEGLIRKAWDQKRPPLPGAASIEGEVKQAVEAAHKQTAIQHESLNSYPESMNDDAFYGLAGDFVRLVGPHTESDPQALLLSCLQLFGCSIGHNPFFQIEKARHTANIFTVLVGDTSKARKGTSLRYVSDLFEIIDPEFLKRCRASGLSSSEGLIERVRDPKQTANGAVDQGVTDKRLFVPEEEFAKVLNVMKRDGNTLSATVRDAWDGKRLQTLARQNHDIATNAHIAIQGHITSEELKSKLTKDDSFNGFANRFLWVMVKRSKSLPRGGSVDEVALNGFAAKIRPVMYWAFNVGFVDMDDETKTLWDSRYEELMKGSTGLFGALTDRNTAQILRLALNYALLDPFTSYDQYSSRVFIRIPHLKAALEVWRYCEASVYHIFGDMSVIQLADSIMEKVKAAGANGMSQTAIHNAFGNNKSAGTIKRALSLLQQRETVQMLKPSTTGKPITIWKEACAG